MSVNAPTTDELVDVLLGMFDRAAETRTEDRHPAPEVADELLRGGYPIFNMSPEQFVDEAFDLWERVRVTEATIGRYADAADAGLAPAYTAAVMERVADDARDDLTFLVARHLGQPAAHHTAA